MAMETREASPSHLLFKIESLSSLDCPTNTIASACFAAGDYQWRLIIYPKGDDNVKDHDHISVHLAMAETKSLPTNWEVNAFFSIFLLNQISGSYLHSSGTTRCFRPMKSEWGISKFISNKVMSDPSNGYLINDNCVFGAEVFIVQRQAMIECRSLKIVNNVCKRDFMIPNFSKLKDIWYSEEFDAGGHKWRIRLHPKGDAEQFKHCVSVYLEYVGSDTVEACFTTVLACFTIRMKSQVSDEHIQYRRASWFSSSAQLFGWPTFIKIDSINDPKKGFLVKDACLLDVKITVRAVDYLKEGC